jgi:hypothetical protein
MPPDLYVWWMTLGTSFGASSASAATPLEVHRGPPVAENPTRHGCSETQEELPVRERQEVQERRASRAPAQAAATGEAALLCRKVLGGANALGKQGTCMAFCRNMRLA